MDPRLIHKLRIDRGDLADVVFKSKREKFNAVAEEICERHEAGQPILVGTISIETSEMLARKLAKQGVKHNVLNAKQHEREAEIVAQAGRKGALTISTNMAGRGTDIVLGGNPEMLALAKCHGDKDDPEYQETLARFESQCGAERGEVVAAGGLHIMGTERHESRRIDNQLRGRSGRQGDPGSTQFFLSLEDDLLRIFESERVAHWWDRVGVEEGEAIENRLLTRVIENAQKKVEARNFDIRKHLLEYDDTMNSQRRRRSTGAGNERDGSRGSPAPRCLDMAEGDGGERSSTQHWPEKDTIPSPKPWRTMVAKAIDGPLRGGVRLRSSEPFRGGQQARRHEREQPSGGAVARSPWHDVLEQKKKRCDALAVQFSAELGYPRLQWTASGEIAAPDPGHPVEGPPAHDGWPARGHQHARLRVSAIRSSSISARASRLFEDMNARIDTCRRSSWCTSLRCRPAPDEMPASSSATQLAGMSTAGGRRRGRRALASALRPGPARPPTKASRPRWAATSPCPCGSGQEVQEVPRRGLTCRPAPCLARSRLPRAGVHCGIKDSGLDLALIASDVARRGGGSVHAVVGSGRAGGALPCAAALGARAGRGGQQRDLERGHGRAREARRGRDAALRRASAGRRARGDAGRVDGGDRRTAAHAARAQRDPGGRSGHG